MNMKQRRLLSTRGTDIEGALKRLDGNEELYLSCLSMFLEDTTLENLNQAIHSNLWDDAFTDAHALKGLAGNLGFVPLMHSTGQLVVLIRGGRLREIGESMSQVNSSYRDITDAIRAILMLNNLGEDTNDN